MRRTSRSLGLSTALLLSATTVVALGDVTATAAAPEPPPGARPFAGASGPTYATPLEATAAPATSARKKHQWPIRSRTGTLTTHPVTPQGDLSQNFESVKVIQDRLKGRMVAVVVLQAAPTEATDARLRVGFGKVAETEEGAFCQSTSGSVAGDVHSYGTSGAYDGDTITYGAQLAGAKTQAWNCAFAQMISPDGATLYDAVTKSGLRERRQKPILSIKVPDKRLERSGFTKVPIKIKNSKQTIAKAPKVKLSWKTKGAVVKARKKVGTIKPGNGKKGQFLVRSNRRDRTGSIKFTVKSKNYKRSVKLKIRPIKRPIAARSTLRN
jgi:hypothetical protein